MKKLIMSGAALILAAIVLTSYTSNKPAVALDSQGIVWMGKKLTGSHSGTLDFAKANIEIKENMMVGASFTVDMTSLKNTDLDEESAGKLVGHLTSDDFFGIKDHPTATFVSKKVNHIEGKEYEVSGDMTIKGVTNYEVFKVTFEGKGKAYQANADIMIDRTKYNVKYGSGKFFENIGDKAIFDEFNLVVQIENHGH